MTREVVRMDVLDLLARGKISVDEAVVLLDDMAVTDNSDVSDNVRASSSNKEILEPGLARGPEVVAEADGPNSLIKEPRWLRISVADSETGASKVRVNLPMAMVKFGLGMAQLFAPEDKSDNWAQFDELLAETYSGILIDVQDDESKEHVRIFVE